MAVKDLTKEAEAKEAKDLTLAEEAVAAGDITGMANLVRRVVFERTEMARAFDSIIRGWSLMHGEPKQQSPEAMFAVERVAHEAIAFAREVVQALTKTRTGDAS